MVHWFCLISLALSNRYASYFEYLFSFTLRVASFFCRPCDLYFMVHWFCLVSPTLSNRKASYFWILVQPDTVNDLVLFVGHLDLYFIVQWFCLLSLALSNRYASYFEYLFSFTLRVTSYFFVGHCYLYFMVQWFCLVSLSISNKRHHTLDTCSVWHCQQLHTICRSLWPIFHALVILPYISGSI